VAQIEGTHGRSSSGHAHLHTRDESTSAATIPEDSVVLVRPERLRQIEDAEDKYARWELIVRRTPGW